MNENTKTIRDLAAYVCDRLAGKVLIHRYDAYSTNSVYLKFDYGVANSLRIADHAGKEHLAYGEPEKIPLSNDYGVSMFFDYGTKALTPDLIFYMDETVGG